MQDEQFALFGESAMVTRRRNRSAPRETFEQGALFATDAGELAGQAAATDELGSLFEVAE